MAIHRLHTGRLDGQAPVPIDQPFTTATAVNSGVSRRQLDLWVATGVVKRPIKGVFYASQLEDTLALRLAVLRLVVPEGCVVTDRTAGWLWGANMILAPNDHLAVPKVSVFCPPGYRLRNDLTSSGERMLRQEDFMTLDGLQVTTPLRTACDLGRLLYRDQAFAAMDSLARLGVFTVEELIAAVVRFAGFRGVIQLRSLAPFVDPGSESPPESILRLRWLDVGLPRPMCQVPVPAPQGSTWWLDVGLEEKKFAAEYDGEAFHTDDEDRAHDDERRTWLREVEGWTIVVARRANMFGPERDVEQLLRSGAAEAGL